MTAQSRASTIGVMPRWPRITLSLPKELIDAVDKLAERKGLSRGSYIRMLLTEHVQEQETTEDQ